MKIAGAILAGGRSTRMGGPKHALRLPDGRTMIEHVAGALAAACPQLVIVDNGIDDARALVRGADCRVEDLRPGEGPLAGVEALLASGLAERYLVVPCDMPLITAADLRLLEETPHDCPAAVFRVQGEHDPRPLPILLEARALPVVRELLDAGERSMRRLVERTGAASVPFPSAAAEHLANINTREEFDRLLEGLDRARGENKVRSL
jgi:molybdopterin-guanine dinucleotide biosynthesis protein A